MLSLHPAEVYTALHCRGMSVFDIARRHRVPAATIFEALDEFAPAARRLDEIAEKLGVQRMAYAHGDLEVAEQKLMEATKRAAAMAQARSKISAEIAARSRDLLTTAGGRKCDHKEILLDVDEGMSMIAIPRKHGVSRQNVWRVQKSYRGERKPRKPRTPSPRVVEAWAMLESGVSQVDVARELGVTKQAVSQLAQRLEAARATASTVRPRPTTG